MDQKRFKTKPGVYAAHNYNSQPKTSPPQYNEDGYRVYPQNNNMSVPLPYNNNNSNSIPNDYYPENNNHNHNDFYPAHDNNNHSQPEPHYRFNSLAKTSAINLEKRAANRSCKEKGNVNGGDIQEFETIFRQVINGETDIKSMHVKPRNMKKRLNGRWSQIELCLLADAFAISTILISEGFYRDVNFETNFNTQISTVILNEFENVIQDFGFNGAVHFVSRNAIRIKKKIIECTQTSTKNKKDYKYAHGVCTYFMNPYSSNGSNLIPGVNITCLDALAFKAKQKKIVRQVKKENTGKTQERMLNVVDEILGQIKCEKKENPKEKENKNNNEEKELAFLRFAAEIYVADPGLSMVLSRLKYSVDEEIYRHIVKIFDVAKHMNLAALYPYLNDMTDQYPEIKLLKEKQKQTGIQNEKSNANEGQNNQNEKSVIDDEDDDVFDD